MSKLCEDIWWSWTVDQIDRIPWEGFESGTAKYVNLREVWWEENTKQNSDGRQIGKNGAHFTNQSTEKKCYFCNETNDNIATAGTRGTEIIQYFACKKWHQRKGFKSSEEKYIIFNVYFLEHHRAPANTVMRNARKISVTRKYHMTNVQPKSMFWYVIKIEELQKMNSFF